MTHPLGTSADTPTKTHRGLDLMKRRLRALLATRAGARLIVAAALALLGFFALDRFLDLPLAVRRFVRLGVLDRPDGMGVASWAFLVLVLGVALVVAWRTRRGPAAAISFVLGGVAGLLAHVVWRSIRPMTVRLARSDLALSLGRRDRELGDRFASALDFEQELASPHRGESSALMRQAVADAERDAGSFAFAGALQGRRIGFWVAGAALALAALGGTAAAWGSDFSLFLRRSLALEDEAWPRATTLVAVHVARTAAGTSIVDVDPNVPYEVAIGRSLTVHARAIGTVPEFAWLVDRADGQEPLSRRMHRAPEWPDVFVLELRDVRRPFRFHVTGGDDEDDKPSYEVQISVPPRIASVRTTTVDPAYLGGKRREAGEGDATVPLGGHVEVFFETDVPAREAFAWVGEERLVAQPVVLPDAAPGAGALPDGGSTSSRMAFQVRLSPTATTGYRLGFTNDAGRSSDPQAHTYSLTVVPDRTPRIVWTWPRSGIETTPRGHVSLLAQAIDDHGIESASLEVRVGDAEPTSIDLASSSGHPPYASARTDGPIDRPEVRIHATLDLRALPDVDGAPLAPQDRVAVRFIAADAAGQRVEGEWTSIHVYEASVVERSIATRRAGVRGAFQSLRRDADARLQEALALQQTPVGDVERDELRTLRFRQGRIAQDADRAAQDAIFVFITYVEARLAADPPTDRILSLVEKHHATSFGLAKPNASPLDGERAWVGDPVFPYALLDTILAGWRTKEIYDPGILDRMLAVMDDAVEAASRLAPLAHRRATEAADGSAETLAALVAQQRALLAVLDRLERAMIGWQSLSDLAEAARGAARQQEEFLRRLEALDGAAAGNDAAAGGTDR